MINRLLPSPAGELDLRDSVGGPAPLDAAGEIVDGGGRVEMDSLAAQPAAGEALPQDPWNELESRIAAVWTEVLEVEEIGLHDNFFDLGGSSLQVARVHHRLQEALGLAIPVLAHYQYTTVHSFAEYLRQGGADEPFFEEGQARAESRRTAMGRNRRLRQNGRVQTP